MSLQEGSATVRRFLVLGDVPAELSLTATVSLRREAWRPIDARKGEKETFGWVNPRNLLVKEFTWDDVQAGHGFVFLGTRSDKKSYSPVLFKARLKDRIDNIKVERKIEKLSKGQRAALKDELHAEMLEETSPRSTFSEIIWDMNAGIVIMGTASNSACELIGDLFFRTFDLRLRPIFPALSGAEFIATQGLEKQYALSTGAQG